MAQANRLGLAHVPVGNLPDGRGNCRREERGLALRGQVLHDVDDIFLETHIQHPIRLVENERAHVAELRGAPLHVVHEAPGRCDDDVDASPQRAQLASHRLATINGRDPDGTMAGNAG